MAILIWIKPKQLLLNSTLVYPSVLPSFCLSPKVTPVFAIISQNVSWYVLSVKHLYSWSSSDPWGLYGKAKLIYVPNG